MTTTVQDAPERSRFEIEVDGELAGFLDYRRDGDEYALPHTRIYPQFEGRGLGHDLVRGTLEEIAKRGGTVLPYCPFVPKVILDNPEFAELVREEERAGFGL